jgi:hypothetical protein
MQESFLWLLVARRVSAATKRSKTAAAPAIILINRVVALPSLRLRTALGWFNYGRDLRPAEMGIMDQFAQQQS